MFEDRDSETEVLPAPQWVTNAMGGGVCLGRVVRCEPSGPVLVAFEGGDPISAKVVAGVNRDELTRASGTRREVLLAFEQGDAERPIVVALMEPPAESLPAQALPQKQIGPTKEAVVDGQTVKIEARNQIVLKCGKGSITITKDGRILIKGTRLVSRASETNKIKGASVSIN